MYVHVYVNIGIEKMFFITSIINSIIIILLKQTQKTAIFLYTMFIKITCSSLRTL